MKSSRLKQASVKAEAVAGKNLCALEYQQVKIWDGYVPVE